MASEPKKSNKGGIQVGACQQGHVHVLVHDADSGEVLELVYDTDDAYELAKMFTDCADKIIGVT